MPCFAPAVATPEITALAQDLTKGATTEREKIKRLYHWVAQNIRYVGIYLGAGGVVPHVQPAS
jgi:transglutaminase-like putative cysteine protease